MKYRTFFNRTICDDRVIVVGSGYFILQFPSPVIIIATIDVAFIGNRLENYQWLSTSSI